MRICIEKSTGRIIESQSGGEGEKDLAVLIANAVNCGKNTADVEAKYVDDAEFQRIMTVQRETEMTYAQKRIREYPPIADYIDSIVKGDATQRQKYINDCLSVKAKYPKPEK